MFLIIQNKSTVVENKLFVRYNNTTNNKPNLFTLI